MTEPYTTCVSTRNMKTTRGDTLILKQYQLSHPRHLQASRPQYSPPNLTRHASSLTHIICSPPSPPPCLTQSALRYLSEMSASCAATGVGGCVRAGACVHMSNELSVLLTGPAPDSGMDGPVTLSIGEESGSPQPHERSQGGAVKA